MEQPSHWTFPISLYGHITVQFLEKWFPFNLTLCHTVQLEPLIINTATLSLASDEASNLILAGRVYWWASDPGHLSLSGHCCWLSSLSLLILSLCHLSEVILTATNKTKPLCQQILFHCCWFSLSLSLSLSVLYFSFFLSEVILKATEQGLPVYKHWVPAQSLLLSLCVTKDCQESSVTVCYKSQNKSQSQRIPHHQNRLNDSQRSQ